MLCYVVLRYVIVCDVVIISYILTTPLFLILLGTFSRRQGQIYMDLTFNNRAMQAMGSFAIQFNKNR